MQPSVLSGFRHIYPQRGGDWADIRGREALSGRPLCKRPEPETQKRREWCHSRRDVSNGGSASDVRRIVPFPLGEVAGKGVPLFGLQLRWPEAKASPRLSRSIFGVSAAGLPAPSRMEGSGGGADKNTVVTIHGVGLRQSRQAHRLAHGRLPRPLAACAGGWPVHRSLRRNSCPMDRHVLTR